MSEDETRNGLPTGSETLLTHGGRYPADHSGFVNTPIYRGSTVVFPSLNALDDHTIKYRYGRQGTPLTTGLEDVISELEGAAGTRLAPSGVSAISLALLSCLSAGDEVLITDSAYEPTRVMAETFLKRLGIGARYVDPRIGGDIVDACTERTKAVFLESPGSLTFELQDIRSITEAVSKLGIVTIVDNSWATPLYLRPLELGADMVVHAGTKMFVGHSDVMMGSVSANEAALPALNSTHRILGLTASPDDTYLTLRGIRTLGVRMQAHQERALALARWLEADSRVKSVLHPALESHPDNALFRRDFTGSGSLFSFILPEAPRAAIEALVDSMTVFAMGYSWGGFESLILPAKPERIRSAVPWTEQGNLFRVHVGLESFEDLKADLAAGLDRYFSILGT